MKIRRSRRAIVNGAWNLRHSASIPNASPRRYLRGFSFAVEWAKIVGCRSTESSLRKACLVRVRHNAAHRTLVAALGFGRCRHGKMFALSPDVPLHLIFKVLPLSLLWVLTAETWRPQWMQCRACTSIAERQGKGEAKMLPLLLNRIDCHIYHCACLRLDKKIFHYKVSDLSTLEKGVTSSLDKSSFFSSCL